MKPLFMLFLLAANFAHAASGYGPYLECYFGIAAPKLRLKMNDGTLVLGFPHKVIRENKHVDGYYVFTADACYPIPKIKIDSRVFYELPTEKFFTYYTGSGVGRPTFKQEKPPANLTPLRLADGDVIDPVKAEPLLSDKEGFEKALLAYKETSNAKAIAALETCAKVEDPVISGPAKKMLKDKFHIEPKADPAVNSKETAGHPTG